MDYGTVVLPDLPTRKDVCLVCNIKNENTSVFSIITDLIHPLDNFTIIPLEAYRFSRNSIGQSEIPILEMIFLDWPIS